MGLNDDYDYDEEEKKRNGEKEKKWASKRIELN